MKLLVRLPAQKRPDAPGDPDDAAWRRPGLIIEFCREEGVLRVGTAKIDLRKYLKTSPKLPDRS